MYQDVSYWNHVFTIYVEVIRRKRLFSTVSIMAKTAVTLKLQLVNTQVSHFNEQIVKSKN